MTARFALCLLGFFAAGCGPNDGVTPVLTDLRFDGQAPDSPLVVLLSFAFSDGDGDLSEGTLDTFINGRPTSAGSLQLLPMFLASDVDPDATEGRLDFALELAFVDENQAPPGSVFALGARVTDGADRTSTTKEIRLQIDYE